MNKTIERMQEEDALAMLGHELLGPSTAVKGSVLRLRQLLPATTPLEAAELLDLIEDASTSLIERIDQLPLLCAEAGAEMLEPILVQRVLPRVINRFQRQHPGRTIHLVAAPDLAPAAANSLGVETILRNLLENADKYSPAGEPVLITAALSGNRLEISVRDRGRGVADDELDAIFGLFYRSERGRLSSGGKGVGLYLCRKLATQMGGSIWAQLPYGSGLLVTFSLQALDSSEP